MPLTAFQHEVFATLRRSRSPDSFVFGATVLNAAADEAALVATGYTVSWQLRQPMFQLATVTRHDGSVKLE